MPSMIVHFLGNATVNTMSGYMLSQAALEMKILYQVIISFGILPTTLMVLWTRFFTSRWMLGKDGQGDLDTNATVIV